MLEATEYRYFILSSQNIVHLLIVWIPFHFFLLQFFFLTVPEVLWILPQSLRTLENLKFFKTYSHSSRPFGFILLVDLQK